MPMVAEYLRPVLQYHWADRCDPAEPSNAATHVAAGCSTSSPPQRARSAGRAPRRRFNPSSFNHQKRPATVPRHSDCRIGQPSKVSNPRLLGPRPPATRAANSYRLEGSSGNGRTAQWGSVGGFGRQSTAPGASDVRRAKRCARRSDGLVDEHCKPAVSMDTVCSALWL